MNSFEDPELRVNAREAEKREDKEHKESLARWDNESEWDIFPLYKVVQNEDGSDVIQIDFLWPPTAVQQIYSPMAHTYLPFELAKVEFGNTESALNFVRTWGLLGLSRLPHRVEKRWGGDPVEFIWWHAKSMRDAITLYELLMEKDPVGLSSALDKVMPYVRYDGDSDSNYEERACTYIALNERKEYRGDRRRLDSDGNPIYNPGIREEHFIEWDAFEAIKFITKVVSSNIERLSSSLYMRGGGIIRRGESFPRLNLGLSYFADSLVETIWMLAAYTFSDRVEVGRCQYCGHFFKRTDKRQRFCPAPEIHVNEVKLGIRNRAQSLCNMKARDKRRRAK